MSEKAYASDLRKIRFAARASRKCLPTRLPPFWALTDPKRVPNPIALARTLPRGGGIIYRHFGASSRVETAKKLSTLARKRGLTLLIGNDPDLAAHVKADGVHWPERALHKALKWRSSFAIMTCAAHSRAAIRHAADMGMDAVLLSTVFASKSPSAAQPMGALRFRRLASGANLPVYALGGIRPENAGQVANFGGFAAIDGLARLQKT